MSLLLWHYLMIWRRCCRLKFEYEHSNGQKLHQGYLSKTHFCNPARCSLIALAVTYVCPNSFSFSWYSSSTSSAWCIDPAALRSRLTSLMTEPWIFYTNPSFVQAPVADESCDFGVMSDVSSEIIATKRISRIWRLVSSTKNSNNFLFTLLLLLRIKRYISQVTEVSNNKRINRNLLRKETSFVCYTSAVVRKSRHMKEIEKLRRPTAVRIKTQDHKIEPS